jgi:hypothetical protein
MKTTLLLFLLLFPLAADALDAVDRTAAADARCEAAREKKLQPIRARKIAACMRQAHPPTAGCETFYSTYGNNSNHANGSVVQGLFYDIPACVEARRTSERLLQRQNF